MWSAVNRLLQLVTSSTAQHAAADLAAHFTTKVEKVRTATSDAPPPVINSRQSTTLADLVPVSVEEAAKLLQSAPNKHCQLDPIPTWILKKSADRFVPLFAALCNSSYSSGLPPSQKHALVSARLKKTTLDPGDLNSYRPISNFIVTPHVNVFDHLLAPITCFLEQGRSSANGRSQSLVRPPGTPYQKLFVPSPILRLLNVFLKLTFSISLLHR